MSQTMSATATKSKLLDQTNSPISPIVDLNKTMPKPKEISEAQKQQHKQIMIDELFKELFKATLNPRENGGEKTYLRELGNSVKIESGEFRI